MDVTTDVINVWKKQYGFVYKAILDGKDYYFKTLSRDDYMAIQARVATEGQKFDSEMEVVLVCVLEPKLTAADLKAKSGLISVLNERIMLRSGFQAVEDEEL